MWRARTTPDAGELSGSRAEIGRPNDSGDLVRAAAIEDVNMAACLSEVESLARTACEPGIWLDVQVSSDLPVVRCDPLTLQNAVLNLLFNARDAMPNGGIISIRVHAISLESRVAGIELRVADSGVGMTSETIIRAFEPFFTTKCDGLGGFGLPMVARFAEEAGGHVLVESKCGVGTTVTLQLPASPPFAARSLTPPSNA